MVLGKVARFCAAWRIAGMEPEAERGRMLRGPMICSVWR